MFSFPNKLYPITDVEISGLSHAEQVRQLIAGGARLIQLREKHLSPREFHQAAKAALDVARLHGAQIIINDRVDIALALQADGVHLGQSDLSPEAARKLLGVKAIIGFSVHNHEQARDAASLPVDYLGIGPIFPTSTKDNPDPVIGLEGLRRTREAAGTIPVVAIGGITLDKVASVLNSGADAVALISTLLKNPREITERTKEFIAEQR